MKSVVDAAVQGHGIAYVYQEFARQELASGALRQILKRRGAVDSAFHLYYPHRAHMPGKLRAFVDFMRAAARSSSS
jgi:DNA-binding transcriptional LysR family regulator